jgi:transcriptional regulator with GAF, ATPase, and Fis domain
MLLRAGASDVLYWQQPDQSAREIAARLERWNAIDEIICSPLVADNLVGRSMAWQAVLQQCVELGRFTTASVLITGETGTGKELAARLIHTLDSRANKEDLIIVDCTTIVAELSGSEFFGHEKGAFTGAAGPRDGAFALANRGTLFLDEVGELPLTLQAQLLRVIQEQSYKRVGGNEWKSTKFRLICATNRDLAAEVQSGRFRADLYYRLAGACCCLPPLRERLEDVLPLSEHFIRQLCLEGTSPTLSGEVREYLLRRGYPGNVRDLRQVISRIMCRHLGPGPVTAGAIPEDERPVAPIPADDWRDEGFERVIRRAVDMGASLKAIGAAAEDVAVQIAMHAEHGNLRRAAQKLGVTDRALQMRRAAAREKSLPANEEAS